MFYTYNQNNSGGIFIVDKRVGQYVIIEAKNHKEADKLAEEKAGIYFDGCETGEDCECCGDRWYRAEWACDRDSDEPLIYGKTIEEFKKKPRFTVSDSIHIYIYYKDRHERIVCNRKKSK